jgi:hypothetical protein
MALLCVGIGALHAAEPGLSVPMKPGLVSVKFRVGLKDKEPTTWEGTYKVSEGRIIATDGWRLAGDDYATTDAFKVGIRRLFPLMWQLQKRDPNTYPVEPNGFILTFENVVPNGSLEVETPKGKFSVPVGQLGYGAARMFLDGNVEVERVPNWRIVLAAPTEDIYPSAAITADGTLAVAYIAFTPAKGFEAPAGLKEEPKDLAFLGAPTGGQQVMFSEMKAGQWSAPVALTPPGGEYFRTALALDGKGRVWVFWSGKVEGNWDLYATVRQGTEWSKPMRLTSDSGSDTFSVAATDSEGRIWLAWQGFRGNNSDIFVMQQDGDKFAEPVRVADKPCNEWEPAIAASADGQVAVAWDTYERGDYDVLLRVWRGGAWKAPRVVASTTYNELRPSLAYDHKNRLWIAYEKSPEGWGKDFGAYNESPRRTALYQKREVGVKVLDGETFYAPPDVAKAIPMPHGGRRFPKSPPMMLAAGPKVAADAQGRVWLSVRMRMNAFTGGAGSVWVNFLTSADGEQWRSATFVPGTDGFLHESPVFLPAPAGGLYVVSASNGSLRAGAFMGPDQQKLRRRSKGIPPATTRTYAEYPDKVVNWEIALADTGRLADPKEPTLTQVPEDPLHDPAPEAVKEAQHIAAIRAYRTEVDGKQVRILRGEFHRHTEISGDGGGDGSIFDMWRYALDIAAHDWIGNGDHQNGVRELMWWTVQQTTDLFHIPGAFTPMFSYERSINYPDGHRNAVFARRGVRPLPPFKAGFGKDMDDQPEAPRPPSLDTQMLYKYLRTFDGVCASHTSVGTMGTDWRDNDPKVEPVVEIYQGDRQSYERPGAPRTPTADWAIGGWRPLGFVSLALMKGYRLGFQSSSDHVSTHMSYCNVFVEEQTREAILEAMKRRHIYGATDNIIADVRCGDHFMGDEFTVNKPPTLRVKLVGTEDFARVFIVKDNEYVYSIEPKRREVEFEWTDANAQPGKTSYYYVRGEQVGEEVKRKVRFEGKETEVTYNNGELVWASPMWITYKP